MGGRTASGEAGGGHAARRPVAEFVKVDPQVWQPHLEILADPDNYPMLVHCQHGVTRTAMFLTAYDMIHRHKTAEESLAVQPLFGHAKANVHLQAFAKNFRSSPTRTMTNSPRIPWKSCDDGGHTGGDAGRHEGQTLADKPPVPPGGSSRNSGRPSPA